MQAQIATITKTGDRYPVLASKQLSRSTHYWILCEGKVIRISSRHASVQVVPMSDSMKALLKAWHGLAYAQAQMKYYRAHTGHIVREVYMHDGNMQAVYDGYFVEADDKYAVAFEMAKRYLADFRKYAGQVESAVIVDNAA